MANISGYAERFTYLHGLVIIIIMQKFLPVPQSTFPRPKFEKIRPGVVKD